MLKFYWEGNFIFAGRKDSEIVNTVEHYQKRFPIKSPDKDNPITSIEKLVVFHMLPIADLSQEFLYFEPVEDVGFQVHPNAIIDLRRQAMSYQKALRGDLYEINPKRSLENLPPLDKLPDPRLGCHFFLPLDVMKSLKYYNYEVFLKGYIQGGMKREEEFKHPNLGLNNTIANNLNYLRQERINKLASN